MSDEIKYLTREKAALKLLQGYRIVWMTPGNVQVYFINYAGEIIMRIMGSDSDIATVVRNPDWVRGYLDRRSLLTLPDYEKLQAQKAEAETLLNKITQHQVELEKPKTKEPSKLEKFIRQPYLLGRSDLPELIEIIKEELGK